MQKKLLPAIILSTLSAIAFNAQAADIPANGSTAYAIDKDGDVVRDNFGGCVRSIDWTMETSLDACEGRQPKPVIMAKPEPVVAPTPAPVVLPEITPKAPMVEEPAAPNVPMHFRGFFDSNSADLKAVAHDDLNAYAKYLKSIPAASLNITGHTDSSGSASYNQKLSERRANAVKAYLVEQGIDAQRINAAGAGESQPIASNKTAEGKAENRRVEVEIVK